MKCDHCGREIADNLATPVTRQRPTAQGTEPVEVFLCPPCKDPRGLTVKAVLVVAALFLLAVGLIALLGYLIT
jgi:hypothetical protein